MDPLADSERLADVLRNYLPVFITDGLNRKP
jgi:hypothetical protein